MNDDTRTVAQPALPVSPSDVTQAGLPAEHILKRTSRHIVPGYELGAELGRGGMGVVYRAKQVSLERDIALKFLRDEYSPTSRSAARFLEEAKITAQLQHPGIPAVHEAGTLTDGRPYLVMKLIQGQTLDALLREEGPNATRWLGIFEGICQAVGYAHSHQIIHRDLKPGNVMVGAHGEVQVMDWGLAKKLGSPTAPVAEDESTGTVVHEAGETANSRHETQVGALLGTPAFMAPEQAIGAVDKVDCRSDVFGLGSVLCMLLTGQPPYVSRSMETTRQMAVKGEQADASARLESCGATPELIALCKRCLASNPDDRPATAAALAEEVDKLRRESDERARTAERERAAAEVKEGERRKRRRLYALTAIGIIAVSIAGAAVSIMQANLAREAQKNAVIEAKDARIAQGMAEVEQRKEKLQRETAEGVANFMQEVFAQGSAAGQATAGRTVNVNLTVKEAMDYAAKRIEGRFKEQPILESLIRNAIGKAYMELAAYPEAVAEFEKALAINEQHRDPEATETLDVLNNLGLAQQRLGHYEEAESYFTRVVDCHERNLGHRNPATIGAINNLGMLYEAMGKHKEAGEQLQKALTLARRNLGDKHATTLAALNNAGMFLYNRERDDEAEPLLRTALEGRVNTLGWQHPDTIVSLNNLANLYESKKRFDAAEKLFLQALPLCETYLGPEHQTTLVIVHSLGNVLKSMARFAEAEKQLLRALAGREKLIGFSHPDAQSTAKSLIEVYRGLKKDKDADALQLRLDKLKKDK